MSGVIAYFNQYVNQDQLNAIAGFVHQKYNALKSNDDNVHIAMAAAFTALLWYKDSYALNILSAAGGFAAQKKFSHQVMTGAVLMHRGAQESKSFRLLVLLSVFAILILCPWRAGAFVFGYYIASNFAEGTSASQADPRVAHVPPSSPVSQPDLRNEASNAVDPPGEIV